MGTRNDDISLILAKAKKQGFLPDVSDSEVDILSAEAKNLFSADNTFSALSLKSPAVRRTLMFTGDSITANGGGLYNTVASAGPSGGIGQNNFQYQPVSYGLWAQMLSGGRFIDLGAAATPGYTTAQILATHIPTVLSVKPDMCVVLAGTNGSGRTEPAGSIADLTAMYTQLISAGILPILCTIPPQNTDSTSKIAINQWIARYARANSLPFVDFHSVLVDSATGNYIAAYSGDGTHPTVLGAKVMGQALADVLTKQLTPAYSSALLDHSGNSAALVANACFTTDNAASPAWPLPWLPQNGSGTTTSFTTDPSVSGRIFNLIRGTADVFVNTTTAPMTLIAGNKYLFGFKPKATVKGVGGGAQYRIRDTATGLQLFETNIITEDIPLGSVILFEYTPPVGLASYSFCAEIRAWTTTNATTSIAQFTALNLTALGIA